MVDAKSIYGTGSSSAHAYYVTKWHTTYTQYRSTRPKKWRLGHIKLILSFSSSPAPDFSARVGPHEYQMGGVCGRVLASRDQIDTSLRSLYIASWHNK